MIKIHKREKFQVISTCIEHTTSINLDVSVCWELKDDVLACETLVDRLEWGELVLEDVWVLWIKVTRRFVSTRALQEILSRARSSGNHDRWKIYSPLDQLATVSRLTKTLTNDFRWEDDIVEDSWVDSSKSTWAWSLLSLLGVTGWLWKDTTLSNEDDVSVRELLL